MGCLQVRVLLEIVERTLSAALWSRFYFSSLTTLSALLGITLLALAAFTLFVLSSLWAAHRLPTLKQRTKQHSDWGSNVRPPRLDAELAYHFFISCTASCAYQARAIKQLLKQALPGLSVSLDDGIGVGVAGSAGSSAEAEAQAKEEVELA